MKSFKLLSLCSLLIFATPHASFAQLKNTTFSSGSDSKTQKVSNGTETIQQTIKKSSFSDGNASVQTVNLTMSGKNMGKLTNEVMLQSFEQMDSQANAAMEQLRLGVSEDSNLGGVLNSTFNGNDNQNDFTMSSSLTTNEQEALMTTNSEEETTILRVDNYTTDTFTNSFIMEQGTISEFDN